VTDVPDQETVYEVVCPHCGKTFEAQPLTGGAARYQGFKCPHCRLFVAYDRVEELEQVDSGSS
jgi:transposase-like protein